MKKIKLLIFLSAPILPIVSTLTSCTAEDKQDIKNDTTPNISIKNQALNNIEVEFNEDETPANHQDKKIEILLNDTLKRHTELELHGASTEFFSIERTLVNSFLIEKISLVVNYRAPIGKNYLQFQWNTSAGIQTENIVINVSKKAITPVFLFGSERNANTQILEYCNVEQKINLEIQRPDNTTVEGWWTIISGKENFKIINNHLIVPPHAKLGEHKLILQFYDSGYYSTNVNITVNIEKGSIDNIRIDNNLNLNVYVQKGVKKELHLAAINANIKITENVRFFLKEYTSNDIEIFENFLIVKIDEDIVSKNITIIAESPNYEATEFNVMINVSESEIPLEIPMISLDDVNADLYEINFNEFENKEINLTAQIGTNSIEGEFNLLTNSYDDNFEINNNKLIVKNNTSTGTYTLSISFSYDDYIYDYTIMFRINNAVVQTIGVGSQTETYEFEYTKVDDEIVNKEYLLKATDANTHDITQGGLWSIITQDNMDTPLLSISGNKLLLHTNNIVNTYFDGYNFELEFVKPNYVPKIIHGKFNFKSLEQFIYDRTFSIEGTEMGTNNSYVGTGWLIADATIGNNNDYKYYLGTNMHVSSVANKEFMLSTIVDHGKTPAVHSYANLVVYEDKTPQWSDCMYTFNGSKSIGVDFSIIEVDFSHAVASEKPEADSFRTRLNNLNIYASRHSGLLFNGIRTFESLQKNETIYTGGYPLSDVAGNRSVRPHWEFGSTTIDFTEEKFIHNTQNHEINDTSWSNGDTISGPQYDVTQHSPLYYHGGGASGSMAIDSEENLVGYYWGVMVDILSPPTIYSPQFEPFSFKHTNAAASKSLYEDFLEGIFSHH